jgi:hypothetical protein
LNKSHIALLVGLVLLFTALPVSAGDWHDDHAVIIHKDHQSDWWENTSFDLDDDVLIITHEQRRRKEVVEITPDYELFIDGEEIELDAKQKALVGDFYEGCLDIYDQAKKIGWEGAKVGVEGAKLGIKAIGCVFKLLSPNYDEDDLERELEREADKIEAKAAILEEKAEIIEDMADELEDLAYDMRREIPALRRLRWF